MVVHDNTRRRATTRARLLDAAREVLAESGIQGATVEQICERAGFTRGAFYSNYASKDELVVDLFNREKERMVDALREAVDTELRHGDLGSIAQVLERFTSVEPIDRTWFLVHQEFVIHAVRHRRIADVYVELWEKTHEEFAEIIEMACEGLGRRLTIDLQAATRLVLGLFDTSLRDTFVRDDAPVADLTILQEQIPALVQALSEPTS